MNCELTLTYDTPAYMFNVYKNQLSRQKGSGYLTPPKRFPQYGIPIWSLWQNIRFLPSTDTEKNAPKNILDGRTERGYNKHDCRLYKQRHHSSLSTNGQEFLHMFSNWKKKKTFFYNYFFSLMKIKLFRF